MSIVPNAGAPLPFVASLTIQDFICSREVLDFRKQVLSLFLSVHHNDQLLKMFKFDLQFLYLCLNQESYQRLDLSLS